MTLSQLRKAALYIRQQLHDHPDVTAIGIGNRTKDGAMTGQRAVIVHVERKHHPTGAVIPDIIVTPFGAVETDIVEAPAANLKVANSVLDGADIIIGDKAARKGTIAFVLGGVAGGTDRYALTNAHVVTGPGGDATGSTAYTRQPGQPKTRIGVVAGHTSYRRNGINASDVALIDLDPAAEALAAPGSIDPWSGWTVSSFGTLSAADSHGSRDTYLYASTVRNRLDEVECTDVVELPGGVTLDDNGTPVTFGRVFRLTAGPPGVQLGHSGALLVRKPTGGNQLEAVGMLFGGSGSLAFFLGWSQVNASLEKLRN